MAVATPLLESETFTQQMQYDALNRSVSMTMPDNSVVRPAYNEANLLENVEANLRGSGTATSFVTNIDYNARGQREKIVYGNGSQTKYTYDPNTFRLTRLLTTRNTGADILQDLNYVFDAAGNITEQVDNAQQTIFFNNAQVDPHGKYTYDALYRLLKAEGRELIGLNSAPGPGDINFNPLPENTQALRRYTQEYEYDEIGNILKMIHQATGGNWTRHYHYNFMQNNYLLSTSPDNTPPATDQYTYDTHGSMLSMPHLTSMAWDFADRLQTADLGGGGMAYYVYDGIGTRVRKVVERNGGVKEERLYLTDWEIYRKSQSGTVQLERETLHLGDGTGKMVLIDTKTIDGGTQVGTPVNEIRYQLSNHLGSATLELDGTTAIISYEEYHPFGTSSYRSGKNSMETSLKRYRYVGKERDEETGLYYYGARYYASWLVRFVSTYPLKDEYPFYTPYQYAGNRPINNMDLDGLEPNPDTDTSSQKRTHTIKEGDTYWGLSRKFGVSVDQLRTWNGYPDLGLPIGSELIISPSLSSPRVIAASARRPLHAVNQPGTLRDDLRFGDLTNQQINDEASDYLINLNSIDSDKSDEQFFTDFRLMAALIYTSGEMDEVVQDMITLFRDNNGGPMGRNFTEGGYALFEDERLNRAVENSAEGQQMLTTISNQITEQLTRGIHPDKITIEGLNRPAFNDRMEHTFWGGLTIAITDTQAFDVTLENLEISKDGTYSGGFTLTIYDHFGLDRGDVTPIWNLYIQAGFRAWYRLQRETTRAYRPFVTRVSITRQFSGTKSNE